jgi:predicted dehydrogenase
MKILIVGLGSIGQRHARNLRRLLGADVELLAYRVRWLTPLITSRLDLDTSKNVEDELGIRAFGDLDKALAERPHVAFICNPSSVHLPPALAAVEAGCDLFIEKPLSHSMEGVAELIAAACRRSRVAMVGYQIRFHPCVRAVADALRERTVGMPLSVRATIGEFMPDFHRYEDYRSTYPAQARLGGGVVLSQIHEYDYLYSLFGLPTRVFAIGGHFSRLEVDVEDTASVLMHCVAGERPLPVHLHQDFLQRPPSRQCEIVGELGKITLDFPSSAVTISNRETGEVTVRTMTGFDRNQLFLAELEHFFSCVRSRQRPLVDLVEGAQSLRVALAVKQSMAEQRVIELRGGDSVHAVP